MTLTGILISTQRLLLQVKHPATGQPLRIQAPLLPDMREACRVLGLECPPELLGDSVIGAESEDSNFFRRTAATIS